MEIDQMSRSPLQAGRAIGLSVILLGASSAFAEDARWYADDQVAHGAAVFAQNCAECHGANAEATPNRRETTPDGKHPPPPLNGTAHAWHHPMDMLRRQINLGGVPLGGVMPAFKDKLSAAEIDAAIAYFQSKWNDEIYGVWIERNGDDDRFLRKVWRSADRRKATDIAMGVSSGDCEEAGAVNLGSELGINLGVNGTPAIVMPDGRLQPGYLPADRLLSALGLKKQRS